MNFLDEDGLDLLIKLIQSDTIQTKSYSGLSNKSQCGFARVSFENNSPWIVKYRITCDTTGESFSLQNADIIIGGIGESVHYYRSFNIINDLGYSEVDNNIVYFDDNSCLLGISYKTTSASSHNVKLEIVGYYGCNVKFLSKALDIYSDDVTKIKFDQKGIVQTGGGGGGGGGGVDPSDLANIAFTGSVMDLTGVHKLTIGNYVYDLKTDVTVPVYDGSIDDDSVQTLTLYDDSSAENTPMQMVNNSNNMIMTMVQNSDTLQMTISD